MNRDLERLDGFLLAAIIDLRKAEQVAARISRKPVEEMGKPVLRTLRNTRKALDKSLDSVDLCIAKISGGD